MDFRSTREGGSRSNAHANRPVRSAAQANTGHILSLKAHTSHAKSVSQSVTTSTTLLPSRELMAHTLTFPRETTANYYPLKRAKRGPSFTERTARKQRDLPLTETVSNFPGGHCDPPRRRAHERRPTSQHPAHPASQRHLGGAPLACERRRRRGAPGLPEGVAAAASRQEPDARGGGPGFTQCAHCLHGWTSSDLSLGYI